MARALILENVIFSETKSILVIIRFILNDTLKSHEESRTKELSDNYDIKKRARYRKDVKTACDSIMNINLQKVHGYHYIYKDI